LFDSYDLNSEYVGAMANIYDIASLIGAFGFGWVTDKLGSRGPTLFLIMFLTIPTIWCFYAVPYDAW